MLEPDLSAAFDAHGLRAIAVEDVTALRTADGRLTLRVELADGGVVKVRRCTRASQRERYCAQVALAADPAIARVRHHGGRIAIEEWIDGATLAALPITDARVQQAADLLARLHARKLGTRRVMPLVRVHRERLVGLVRAGAMSTEFVHAVLALAPPVRAPVGAIHGDLCGENLVEDRAGRVIAIDNEHMREAFVDYDLARTWYRWSLPAPAWETFAARYARVPAAWPFWCAVVLVESASLRWRVGAPGVEVPLQLLEGLSL